MKKVMVFNFDFDDDKSIESNIQDVIDKLQQKAEEFELSGNKEMFELLDLAAHYLRESGSWTNDTIEWWLIELKFPNITFYEDTDNIDLNGIYKEINNYNLEEKFGIHDFDTDENPNSKS